MAGVLYRLGRLCANHAIAVTTAPAQKAGVGVTVGGNLGRVLSKSPTESSEVIGLLDAPRGTRQGPGSAFTSVVTHVCDADPQSVACQDARTSLAAAEADLAAAQQALAAKKAQL
jgi:hypothetical protein